MTHDELKKLKAAIATVSAYYGRQMTDAAISMYAEDLFDLELFSVLEAIKKYRMNTQNRQMFIPANIREILSPKISSLDLARETTMRIRHAIKRFGWPHPEAAREHIGDAGWRAVERMGGWQHLCENLGVEIPEHAFMAQCRDAIESNLRLGNAGIDVDRPAIEQANERAQIPESIAKLLKPKLIDGGSENA